MPVETMDWSEDSTISLYPGSEELIGFLSKFLRSESTIHNKYTCDPIMPKLYTFAFM
jgi:hypothetical protein